MVVEDTLTMRQFPVIVKTSCKNIDKIYPLKQKQVSEIYEIAVQFPIVKRVIVFGSSVTAKCNIESDLDLCVDADTSDGLNVFELQKMIGKICDWNCDIVMYSNIGSALKNTINKEGVVIYE